MKGNLGEKTCDFLTFSQFLKKEKQAKVKKEKFKKQRTLFSLFLHFTGEYGKI